jgi:chromodomain-helicase-DNA-binding protein 4
VTRASAEEKIMQIGRRKLALDHVLIQEMDTDDADEQDLASVLRHGASELFEDDGEHDIVYDSTSVEHLLDRSRVEDTNAVGDKSAETQFSNARVWANNSGGLEDLALDQSEDTAPDPGVWANILKERERVANEEAAAKAEALGRGRRNRGNIDYGADKLPDAAEGLDLDVDTLTPLKKRRRKSKNPDETDTDFQADDSDAESGAEDGENARDGMLDTEDVNLAKQNLAPKKPGKQTSSLKTPPKTAPAIPVNIGKTGVKGGTSSVTNGAKTSSSSLSKKTVAVKKPVPKPAAKPAAKPVPVPAKKRSLPAKKDDKKPSPAGNITSSKKTTKASTARAPKKLSGKKLTEASKPKPLGKLSKPIVVDTPTPEPQPAQTSTTPNTTKTQ